MKNKKVFTFWLDEDIKEELRKRVTFGVTMAHLINKFLRFQIEEENRRNANIKKNEELYGPITPPEDIDEMIKEAKKRFS
jgi:molybdopterin converting factor small subunit